MNGDPLSALSVPCWDKVSRVCGWRDARTRDPRDEGCDPCGGPLPPLPPRVQEERDPLTGRREAGERVWVVFDPKEPRTHALWPPVA